MRQDSRHRDLALPAAAAGRERSSHFSRNEIDLLTPAANIFNITEDDDGVIGVDEDRSMRTAQLGVVSVPCGRGDGAEENQNVRILRRGRKM